MECMGAMNCKSYEENLINKRLPQLDSLTYQGTFNSNFFKINSKLDIEGKNTLDLEFSNFSFNNPISKTEELFLSLIIKTKYDGVGARKPIDLTFVLDKSGSMSDRLGTSKDSCISVAKSAIFKLIAIMLPEDRLTLVAVDNNAHTIFSSQDKASLQNEKIEKEINSISASGGTELNVGYLEALKAYSGDNYREEVEKRIIFSTDMNYLNDKEFESNIRNATTRNIFTTILGIGVNLDSNFLERISKNKGFNYFSATSESHLNDIIIENFQYYYFPVAHNLQIDVKGKIEVIDSYGSDYSPVKSTNEDTAARNEYSIVKVNSFTSSSLVLRENKEKKAELYMKGGLILIKYKNLSDKPEKIEVNFKYEENFSNPNYVPKKTDTLNQTTLIETNTQSQSYVIESLNLISDTDRYNISFYLYVNYSRQILELALNTKNYHDEDAFSLKYLDYVKKIICENVPETKANELNDSLSKLYDLVLEKKH